MSNGNDFPRPSAAAGYKAYFSIAAVLFSFTFFTGTMFAGGKLGVSPFPSSICLWIAVIGNASWPSAPRRWSWIARAAPEYGADGPVLLRERWRQAGDYYSCFAELGWCRLGGTATVAISLVKIPRSARRR